MSKGRPLCQLSHRGRWTATVLSLQVLAPGGIWFLLQVKRRSHPGEFSEDDRDHMSNSQSVDSETRRRSQSLPLQSTWRVCQFRVVGFSGPGVSLFSQRAGVMKAVPGFMKGA